MDIQELINLGLTANQAQLYLALLKQSGQSAGELAKKISLDRSFTYNILKTLEEKAFVTHIIRDGKRLYLAAPPENFLRELDEQRTKVAFTVEKLKKIKQETTQEINVQIYEGTVGIKTYVREVIKSPYFYTLGGSQNPNEFIEKIKYDFPHIMNELVKKNIDAKIIMTKDAAAKVPEIKKRFPTRIRTLDQQQSDISFVALKDKIAIWSAAEKPFAIIIEAPGVAEALTTYFKQLWEHAEK
ncbi:MAG: helix-turn-helix domain-containing protein [Candidatus Woesearchaeota archaeon]|jgi:sugar-specific transcriptional regulator TrmB